METTLEAVGVREAKNSFSQLAHEVNRLGTSVTVLKNGKPWVAIVPVDEASQRRRERLRAFRLLTERIESADEPQWDPAVSDDELLGEAREKRFG